ncbi:DEAD/DEAH box helicase [Pseudobutyrivibrio sp.]|uniref:DEAD/DEAH box helicase n=1 Tax=Pseudobutyrivibrio sp. TaxID=2014367 RepID=UPI00386B91BA
MVHDELKKYMMQFSTEELKEFLGRDLVDSLLEWNTDNEAFSSKKRLADMIISVYGTSILKRKDFRKRLLKSFQLEELERFKDEMPAKYKDCKDPGIIVDYVSNCAWKESATAAHILRVLNYATADIFEKKEFQSVSVETIEAHEKFYELLDYQYIIRQKALTILQSNLDLRRFLIHMPTGTGKTKTATHIICNHYSYNLRKKGLVLWVAHTTELLEQAYETFCSVWRNIGKGSIQTYKLWNDFDFDIPEDGLNGFMVCGIQKLQSIQKSNEKLFEQIVKDTRLLVYDEAHKASAKETRATIEAIMTRAGGLEDRALMGLSATPGRTTTESFDNELLASMFGNKIIGIDTKLMNAVNLSPQEAANAKVEKDVIKYFQNRGVLSKIEKEELEYKEKLTEAEINSIRVMATNHGYDDFSKNALETIGKNKSRNLRILNRLRELNDEKKPTIVFACSVKHAQLLSAMLTLENVPNGVVYGDMPAFERAITISRFKDTADELNILINYEVLTTGFDATNIECVFIARPTQSIVLYSQMLGRGLRGPQMGGNEKCLLIDVKDNLRQYNENMAFSHFNNYWG